MSLNELYPWIKAAHVVAAVTFASGVLMTAVLLSSPSREGDASANAIVQRARRWDTRVTTPAMVLTWVLGLSVRPRS